MTEKQNSKKHENLILENRARLTITGISDVENFTTEKIVFVTESGELTVTGKDMKVKKLSAENGDAIVEGEINGCVYSQGRREREGSSRHQLDVFFLCIFAGILCGIFFDLQRSVRKISCKGRIITTIQDLLFALFYVGVALFVGFNFNHGEVRYYQVLGVFFGILLYLLLFSNFISFIFTFYIFKRTSNRKGP